MCQDLGEYAQMIKRATVQLATDKSVPKVVVFQGKWMPNPSQLSFLQARGSEETGQIQPRASLI